MEQFESLRKVRPPEGTDLKTLAAIADAHAFEVWGEEIARGEPFPVADAGGNVRAYVFPYALGTRTFPADASLAGRQPDPSVRCSAVYVAARRTAQPVLRVVHALHPLFVRGEKAETVGRSVLGAADACITRIYWLGLHQEYFEIAAAGQRLLLDVDTLRQVEPETVLRQTTAPAEESQQEVGLEKLTKPTPPAIDPGGRALAAVLKLVPLADCVPVVDWTWWCVPTAWTMATCYYDNFVKGVGGVAGYGRLVGHWLDDPKSGHNVPDFLNQIVDPETGTWRTGFNGYSDFVQKTYGYAFTSRDVTASAGNDWAWADITAEIDAGRPFVWGVPNHATCAFGYRIATNGKFVVLHTTWGSTEQSQREEWLYTQGTGLTAITPGGGTAGQSLALWAPDGGETVLTNVATSITWFVWGDQIKTAEISASTDGGNTWTVIRQEAPCTPGWNSCDWTPAIPTERARVRVRGHDAASVYIAGDGSQGNVKVLPGPRPVTLKTVLVKAKTDAKGFFSAPHGMERYTPDGYAIRAISVAVQHKNGNWHTLEYSHSVDNRFWWNKDVVAGVIASPNFSEQPVQIVISAEIVVG
jgi:hypothetical protein